MPDITAAMDEIAQFVKNMPQEDMAEFLTEVRTVFNAADVPSSPGEVTDQEQLSKLLASFERFTAVVHQWAMSAAIAGDATIMTRAAEADARLRSQDASLTSREALRSALS